MPSFLFHSSLAKSEIHVGVSACLLGYQVRYDGKTKTLTQLFNQTRISAQWHPVCPEITLGVPRPPVQLVKMEHDKESIQAIGVIDTRLNVTATLQRHSQHILDSEIKSDAPIKGHEIQQLKAMALGQQEASQQPLKEAVDIWLLKARSPSCGSQTTPLHNRQGEILALGDGLFTQACRALSPLAAIFDESAFSCERSKNIFYLSALITQDVKQASDNSMPTLIAHYKSKGLLNSTVQDKRKSSICQQLHKQIQACNEAQLAHYIDSIKED